MPTVKVQEMKLSLHHQIWINYFRPKIKEIKCTP
jgi:hypothetical protein